MTLVATLMAVDFFTKPEVSTIRNLPGGHYRRISNIKCVFEGQKMCYSFYIRCSRFWLHIGITWKLYCTPTKLYFWRWDQSISIFKALQRIPTCTRVDNNCLMYVLFCFLNKYFNPQCIYEELRFREVKVSLPKGIC